MPIIKATLRVKGEEETFCETDIYRPTGNPKQTILDEKIKPWNERRKSLGESEVELVAVQITNPYWHLHDWKLVRTDKFALKAYYVCLRCRITGHKYADLLRGVHEASPVAREEAYKNLKFELCRDPLKELPKKINLA